MKDLHQIAEALYRAEEDGVPVEPITIAAPGLTVDDAYEIQSINIARRLKEGRVITGKKIGLTSKAMQDALGVDSPDYGILFDSMVAQGGVVPKDAILQPKVEGELAFVLKSDLPKNPTLDDVLQETDYVAPAIEVVGSRIANWKLTLVDTVADNASCGMYVLGDVRIDPRKTDLREIVLQLYKNGKLVNSGKGVDVLGHPANAVVWLANSLEKYGVSLNKGDVILSGALSAAVAAEPGDAFVCNFGEYGRVDVRFE